MKQKTTLRRILAGIVISIATAIAPATELSTKPKEHTNQTANLILQRDIFTEKSISGKLYLDTNNNGYIDSNDKRLAYTLELPYKNNQNNLSCIPKGNYEITERTSQKFGQHYLVNNVPGRSDILIHVGNYPKDTTGCILIGTTRQTDFVGNSKTALKALRQELSEKDITLKITGSSK